MIAAAGLLLVVACIIGGFLMEGGPIQVLIQPAEFLIIIGSAAGMIAIANSPSVLKRLLLRVPKAFAPDPLNRDAYLRTLTMLYQLFTFGRKHGLQKLEHEIDHPLEGEVFSQFPELAKNAGLLNFLCDSLRLFTTGGTHPADIGPLLETAVEVDSDFEAQPASALLFAADALPGLGIVAAVLGIVITMQALSGPPSQVGTKVASSLVGTFLGILMSYGFAGPIASAMAKQDARSHQHSEVLRVAVSAFIRGDAPIVAVEYARRAVPIHSRPTFSEMEALLRKPADAPAAAQPAAA